MHFGSGSTSSLKKKGIEITSDEPCSVTVLTHHAHDAVEGFMALPVNALSTKYVLSSCEPYSGASSEFLLVAMYNNTRVDMVIRHYDTVKTRKSVTINEYNTYLYTAAYDMSNSIISSNKPVAVFSGSGACKIPPHTGDYQYIVEQMIPTEFWPKKYIVPVLYPMVYYQYRIYNVENVTAVQSTTGTTKHDMIMNQNYYTTRASQPTVILADKPISVIQYGYYFNSSIYDDSFMTTVQAISQFQSSYEFVTDFDLMHSLIWPVTLTITVLTADIPGLILDNSSLVIQQGHMELVPAPFSNYTIVYINMTSNKFGTFHILRHRQGRPFGAMLYSMSMVAAGAYGYPLKFALEDKGM